MIPSIGRIVHYTLTADDAEQINRRRTSGAAIKAMENWPSGAQAHIGNQAKEGQIYPAMIVRTWGDTESAAVQLQVFLDGNDTFWATSRNQGVTVGQWFAPPRV